MTDHVQTADVAEPVVPDANTIALYADVVFGYCEFLAPVRALAEKGAADAPPHTPFLPVDGDLGVKLAHQADWAAQTGMALFVVPGTVHEAGAARSEHIAQMQVVLVDIDHGDIAAKRSHLIQHLGTPTLEVASGGVTPEGQDKLHLYWRLTEPAEGEDIARVCRARQMIAAKVGGDPSFKSAHQPIRVGLRGARVVTSIETEQGSRWAESKLKALTGGDKITARFMRQDFFEFIPQFKLLIVGNHKPTIRNVDEAMKRRLHMVPFTITIPSAKRDKRLPDRLLAERDGILAWALQGCLEWQQHGLRPPPAVMAATEDYFEAEDALGRWIEERCETGSKAFWAGSTELFNSWKTWAEANGEYGGSMKRFSETLATRGFEKFKSMTTRGYRGIKIKDIKADLFEGDYNDQ